MRMESSFRGNTPASPFVDEVLRSRGQPHDPQTRGFMETRFGHDFSGVRVNSDERAASSANDISNAHSMGSHIVFGAGQFDPSSSAGRRLLAHELTHIIQQSRAGGLSLQCDKREGEAKDVPEQAAPV